MGLIIAVDFEDVITAFYPKMCEYMGIKCIKQNIWSENNQLILNKFYEKIKFNNRFFMNVNPLSNPADVDENFISYFISQGDPRLKQTKENWLTLHNFQNIPLIMTTNKLLDIQRLGVDYLIDDNPYVLESAVLRGVRAIQFIPPYMSNIDSRFVGITHLSEIEGAVAKIKKL